MKENKKGRTRHASSLKPLRLGLYSFHGWWCIGEGLGSLLYWALKGKINITAPTFLKCLDAGYCADDLSALFNSYADIEISVISISQMKKLGLREV